MHQLFDLSNRIAVITGGAGLLGVKHAEAIAEAGGIPVLVDINGEAARGAAGELTGTTGRRVDWAACDVTDVTSVRDTVTDIAERFGRIDILINNAALTVKGGAAGFDEYFAPFEDYPQDLFDRALRVNLTGAFLITQAVGRMMAQAGKGVVVNISSDVAMISPDHRIYEGMTVGESNKPFNTPIAYSMSKAALLAFTRYLATYWAPKGIRVNALSPAGVYDNHPPEFVQRLSQLIPLGRMARVDEYKGAILYLCSDASSFMTGANLVVDGGRTSW